MVVPGWKQLFFLRNRRETQEDFGQNCEVAVRKGQILTILVLQIRSVSPDHALLEIVFTLTRRLSKFIFSLFEPLLQITSRHIAAPQTERQSER
jgi:hypothetical protein